MPSLSDIDTLSDVMSSDSTEVRIPYDNHSFKDKNATLQNLQLKDKVNSTQPEFRYTELIWAKMDSGGTPAVKVSINKNPNDRAGLIIRAHFAKQILSDLGRLSSLTGQPISAAYSASILRNIILFRENSPYDPFYEVLAALYDAMAFENRWARYSSQHYEGAYQILLSCVEQVLDNKKVRNAIINLEKLGFDTLPFNIGDDFNEDDYEAKDEEE